MSIQNAMQAGVAGLKANAAAVGRISENIANSNTIGYKRSFTNMVTSVAGESKSVNAVSRSDMADRRLPGAEQLFDRYGDRGRRILRGHEGSRER